MPTVKIDYFGVEGIGKTVTEAKRDAGARIESTLKNIEPDIFSHRGSTLIVWTTLYGTAYSIVHPDNEPGRKSGSCHTCDDRFEATCRAIHHMLDITRKAGEYDLPEWIPANIARKYARRWANDWRANDEFQQRYRDAQARGMNDQDCHDFAGRNPARPELWSTRPSPTDIAILGNATAERFAAIA